jgi:hypothetical protein
LEWVGRRRVDGFRLRERFGGERGFGGVVSAVGEEEGGGRSRGRGGCRVLRGDRACLSKDGLGSFERHDERMRVYGVFRVGV